MECLEFQKGSVMKTAGVNLIVLWVVAKAVRGEFRSIFSLLTESGPP